MTAVARRHFLISCESVSTGSAFRALIAGEAAGNGEKDCRGIVLCTLHLRSDKSKVRSVMHCPRWLYDESRRFKSQAIYDENKVRLLGPDHFGSIRKA